MQDIFNALLKAYKADPEGADIATADLTVEEARDIEVSHPDLTDAFDTAQGWVYGKEGKTSFIVIRIKA